MDAKILFMKDIADLDMPSLLKKREEFRKYLFQLTMKNSLKNLKETHHIKIMKKNLARINTALHSKLGA